MSATRPTTLADYTNAEQPDPTPDLIEIPDAVTAWVAHYDAQANANACPFCGRLVAPSAWPQHVDRARCTPREHSEVFGRGE